MRDESAIAGVFRHAADLMKETHQQKARIAQLESALAAADKLAEAAERISPKIHWNDLVKPVADYRKARGSV